MIASHDRRLRLLIVEEALKNRSGHWYEYNRALVGEGRSRGLEVTLLAHRNIDPEIRDELGAEAFFPVTSWDLGYNHPVPFVRYLGILHHNLRVAVWMIRHFKAQAEPYDVVLVPTVVLYHWLAWRFLYALGKGRWFQRLVLISRNNAGEYDPSTGKYVFTASAKALKLALSLFRKPVAEGGVQLGSDSARLAEQHGILCGVPFMTFPHPRPTSHLPLPRRRDRSQGTVFSALGPPRFEKGSDLILGAVSEILGTVPDFPGRFVLQWSADVFGPDGTAYPLPPEWKDHPKVEIIRESLDSAGYQKRLDEADVLLLPYRRSQYHARLSGIAIESFQSGVPCICVSDTWVEDCMKEIGGGIAIANEAQRDLSEAILAVSEDRDFSIPVERCVQARARHSPSRFFDFLLGEEEAGRAAGLPE
jgi:glycosyltransferase involved in cell wall biosynthesis